MKRRSAPAILFINVIAIEENSAPTPLNRMVPSAQEAAAPSAATTPIMWSFKLSRGGSHSSVGPEKISPTGPDESSPVRSAGLLGYFHRSLRDDFSSHTSKPHIDVA